jgi:serine/threonine protein kinase
MNLLWFQLFNIICIAASTSSTKDISDLIEESLKMKSFHHPNVLHLIGVCIDAGAAPYLVMPYMFNGSLLSYLRKERPKLTIVEGATEDLVRKISLKSWHVSGMRRPLRTTN